MLRPTLLIGLGSSGLHILSEVQKLMYETFGRNTLPIFRSIYLETDSGQNLEKTPVGSDVIPLRLEVDSLTQALQILQNNPQIAMDWISADLPAQMAYNAQGAGGVRPAGRLLLWGGKNFHTVYNTIQGAWREIVNPNLRQTMPPEIVEKGGGFSEQPIVYVTGTLVGGTCSGSFIDVGYILRNITGLAASGALYGIFLLPREGLSLSMGYGNCHGALTELEFFRQPGNFYQETWPNGVYAPPNMLPPYAIVYLVAPEYGKRDFGNMELWGCYKMVALRLFCDLIGLSNTRGGVLADGMNEGYGYYATFGISAVMYPKYSLMESAACSLGEELCSRWLQEQSYLGVSGEQIVINEGAILEEATAFFDEKLTQVFNGLGARGDKARTLQFELQDAVEKVLRGEEGDSRAYLAGRFGAGSEGNYFAVVQDNIASALDSLVEAIHSFVLDRMDATQNLEYTKTLLEKIRSVIGQTLDYWNQSGIPANASEWNEFVNRQVNRLLESTNRIFLQRRPTLQDRMEELLSKLKMFLARQILSQLKAGLEKGNLTTVNQKVALPTIERIRTYRDQMQKVREELKKRGANIAVEVADDRVPVYRVWNSGSFDADRNSLLQAQRQRAGVPTFRDVSTESAWVVFQNSNERELFELIKVEYQKQFRQLLPPVSPVQAAAENIDLTRQYANRALAGLLALDFPGRSGEHGVPRFLIGSSTGQLNQLVDRLGQQGAADFKPADVREMPLLDHAVVFYEEKAGLNPLRSLSVRQTLQRWFEQPGTDATGAPILSTETWKQHRLAYNLPERERRIQLAGVIDFVLNFGLEWKSVTFGEWKPTARRWEELPVSLGVPPVLTFDDNGLKRSFRLDPNSPRTLSEIAKEPAFCQALDKAIRSVMKNQTRQSLIEIFETDVKPRLEKQGKTTKEIENIQDRYFGKPGDPSCGILSRLLSATE